MHNLMVINLANFSCRVTLINKALLYEHLFVCNKLNDINNNNSNNNKIKKKIITSVFVSDVLFIV